MPVIRGIQNGYSMLSQRLSFVRVEGSSGANGDRAVNKLVETITDAQKNSGVSDRRALYSNWLQDPQTVGYIQDNQKLKDVLSKDRVFVNLVQEKLSKPEQEALIGKSGSGEIQAVRMADLKMTLGNLSKFTRVDGQPPSSGGNTYGRPGSSSTLVDRLNQSYRVNTRG